MSEPTLTPLWTPHQPYESFPLDQDILSEGDEEAPNPRFSAGLRVLVGSVTAAPPEILAAHLKTILWQDAKVDFELCYIVDNASPETLATVREAGARALHPWPKEPDASYNVNEVTHDWSLSTLHWLGRERQRLIELAVAERFDALLIVDSDLLLGPETLRSLLGAERPVVSAVFWTRWTPTAPPLPQVWTRHPYGFDGLATSESDFLRSLSDRQLTRVLGLGACTLIRSDVYRKVGYAPPLLHLPQGGLWQGEDRHFCIRASQNNVQLWADSWPDIFHVYRPSDIARMEAELARLSEKAPERAQLGDLVSFTLEPLEEPALGEYKAHMRGRLGQIRVLPEVEEAIQDMTPMDQRLLRVEFPIWYEAGQYRGQVRLVRLTLLGVKPNRPPPNVQ